MDTDLQASSVPESRISPEGGATEVDEETEEDDGSREDWSGVPNDAFMWEQSSLGRNYVTSRGPQTYPDGIHYPRDLPPGFHRRDIYLPQDLDSDPGRQEVQNGDLWRGDDDYWIGRGVRIATNNGYNYGPFAHLFPQ